MKAKCLLFKFFVMILLFAMIGSLVSCGAGSGTSSSGSTSSGASSAGGGSTSGGSSSSSASSSASSSSGSSSSGSSSASSSTAAPAKEYKPFKIGMCTPLTGTSNYGGNESKYSVEVAQMILGDTVNGRKIEYVITDAPDVDAYLSEFERLADQGITFFHGGYGAGNADRTIVNLVDEMKVVYLSESWSPDATDGTSKFFYRTQANARYFGLRNADSASWIAEKFLNKKPNELKVAIVYGTGTLYLVDPFKERAAELGITIVIDEGYAPDTQDFVPIITKLKNGDFDILIPFQGNNDGYLFQKKMAEMGYRPNVTMASGMYYDSPAFIDLGNDITNGILSQSFTTPWMSDNAVPGISEYREKFNEHAGHYPLTHALTHYMQTFIIYQVLGKLDPADWDNSTLVAQTLAGMDLDYGIMPTYWGLKFGEGKDANNNLRSDQFIVGQWQGGEYKVVGPDQFATGTAKVPWQ